MQQPRESLGTTLTQHKESPMKPLHEGSPELDARLTVETLIDAETEEIQPLIASLIKLARHIKHVNGDTEHIRRYVSAARRYNRQVVYMNRIKRFAIGAELCHE